jgi:uncharacterized membrane protein YedE/YeeE
MNRQCAVALLSGLLFAVGLGLSGMTQPQKVLAFLDVFGAWDPALLFVMIGAISVHMIPALRAGRLNARPMLGESFKVAGNTSIDARLIAGAALFGMGWGAAGYCPGPAVVSVVTLTPTTLSFVGAMLCGMAVYAAAFDRKARVTQGGSEDDVASQA